MNRPAKILIFLNLFFCFSLSLYSSASDSLSINKNEKPIVSSDSSNINDSTKFNTLDKMTENKPVSSVKFEMKKSPFGAIWRSLLLPGWGQIYVESYWKAPLFAGGAGFLIYLIIWNNTKFLSYQAQYTQLINTDSSNANIPVFKLYKEYYRDNRDQSAFYLLGVYILAAVDAYVGAHLYDFNVNDNLSFNIVSKPFQYISLQLTYTLK